MIVKIYNKSDILVDIEFEIEESLALIGESGSGKSLTLKAILGLLPKNLSYSIDSTIPSPISIVVQNPFTALSPLTKIGKHFEVKLSEQERLLKLVGLDSGFLNRYPSELSGGQLQRVVIAIALSIKPKLLLLDEPTTALDSQTKYDILIMIDKLRKEFGFKILYVTHDIESSKLLCEDMAILKSGKIVERGKVSEILNSPKDEYTKRLIESNFNNRGFRE
jgi:peptide/nickel transport system ATP-binding protein